MKIALAPSEADHGDNQDSDGKVRAAASWGLLLPSRHRLNGHLAQRVPGLFLASGFRICLNVEAVKGLFPWD